MSLKMTRDDLTAFMALHFEQVADQFSVEEVGEHALTMRLLISEQHLRPGGTVSGPTMFLLADVAVYLTTLAMIGPKALAVTTNCSIDFLRKPAAGVDLVAKCQLLKLGKALAVGDVLIYSQGMADPVARATLTYSIPPTTR
ncbi:MAG: PaaI family thioesterase [Rhodobacterales bacterium]|nr:PaaI family thioesterase [Rhodobacterales bacterium]